MRGQSKGDLPEVPPKEEVPVLQQLPEVLGTLLIFTPQVMFSHYKNIIVPNT